jgi:hypothetical protein
MQTEQQTTTTQNKKTHSAKNTIKKQTKKSNEQVEEQTTVVQQPIEQVVQSVVAPVTQQDQLVTANLSTDETVVLNELDVNTILDFINTFSDKCTEYSKYFKDNTLSKEERAKMESGFKKLSKSTSLFNSSYTEYLLRQVSVLEKSSGSKSGAGKKVTDKEKAAIHKKLPVHPFLLNFMNLEPNTLVSRSDSLAAITGFVKQEKIKNNPEIIVSDDKRSFKLIGDLKVLFDNIQIVMNNKNLLEGKTFPTELKYTQIMQYMTHCFIKADDVNVNVNVNANVV